MQRRVGAIPEGVSQEVYYALQRSLGGLRHPHPLFHFRGAIAMVHRIQRRGRSLEGSRFLEIGTGRQLNVPIALWLCGARSIVTVDLNRYLKPAIVFDNLSYMRAHREDIVAMFAGAAEPERFSSRLDRLFACRADVSDLMQLLGVRYEAPADATRLSIPDGSIDYHASFTVLEHVPPPVLERMFAEGRRVLAPDGLFVHFVDFSDHFSHADPSITAVNFLRFADEEWLRLAGNRYAYHNRLRVDEFAALLARAGAGQAELDPTVDERSLAALRAGMPLDSRFASKPAEINATIDSWVVAERTQPHASAPRPLPPLSSPPS